MAAKKTAKKDKAPNVKEMTDAIIENMDRITDEDVETVLRAHIAKMGADKIKEMYHETVELPEQRIDAILAGLKLLADTSEAKRIAMGIGWSDLDLMHLTEDIERGDLELVETEDE